MTKRRIMTDLAQAFSMISNCRPSQRHDSILRHDHRARGAKMQTGYFFANGTDMKCWLKENLEGRKPRLSTTKNWKWSSRIDFEQKKSWPFKNCQSFKWICKVLRISYKYKEQLIHYPYFEYNTKDNYRSTTKCRNMHLWALTIGISLSRPWLNCSCP